MPLSTVEFLAFLGGTTLLGIILYFSIRAYDRHLDGPALQCILMWARENNHRIIEVRKRRGGSGRLGTNPRLYSVTVATADGGSRPARVEIKPTFAGVAPGSLHVVWDAESPDAVIWSETLRLPDGP